MRGVLNTCSLVPSLANPPEIAVNDQPGTLRFMMKGQALKSLSEPYVYFCIHPSAAFFQGTSCSTSPSNFCFLTRHGFRMVRLLFIWDSSRFLRGALFPARKRCCSLSRKFGDVRLGIWRTAIRRDRFRTHW